ncbi:hypothetical protein IG631_06327 [Alternaria alternata]|nr:hypothetical protein IG631_06327 [Alternaria alternata]
MEGQGAEESRDRFTTTEQEEGRIRSHMERLKWCTTAHHRAEPAEPCYSSLRCQLNISEKPGSGALIIRTTEQHHAMFTKGLASGPDVRGMYYHWSRMFSMAYICIVSFRASMRVCKRESGLKS